MHQGCAFCAEDTKKRIIEATTSMFVVEDQYPVTKNHCLIIPFRHTEDLFSMTEVERRDADDLARYPIIFKSVLGLSHADSPVAEQLGVRFFDYALAVKARRDSAAAADLTRSQPLDLSGFDAAPFYGDLMNQEMFAAGERDMIPSSFLVPLPSREIAEAWNK
jgi:hypothetical protein